MDSAINLRILLTGLPRYHHIRVGWGLNSMSRCGKSSIQRLVFRDTSPSTNSPLNATSPLQSTTDLLPFLQYTKRWANANFTSSKGRICLQVVDLFEINSIVNNSYQNHIQGEHLFGSCDVIIFVVDIVDDYVGALGQFCALMVHAARYRRAQLPVHVLLHKTDSMAEDERQEIRQEVDANVHKQMQELNVDNFQATFHLTNSYDYSVHEAIGRIISGLLRINIENTHERADCTMLFDVHRKLCIASAGRTTGSEPMRIGAETVDFVCDLAKIYARAQINPVQCSITLDNGKVVQYAQINQHTALLSISDFPIDLDGIRITANNQATPPHQLNKAVS